MREVTHCDRPTLSEAWALVLGTAVPVVSEEPGAIALWAKRSIPDLQREPALVVAEIPERGPVAPFWNQQWSWNDGQQHARIGHQYLSVHWLVDDEHPYESYQRSLQPSLNPWLDACKQTYHDPERRLVAQVGFGYINAFEFSASDFNLATYFHVNFAARMDGLQRGLEGLDFKFHYRDELAPAARITVQILAQAGSDTDETLRVRTLVTAMTAAAHHWTDKAEIEQAISNTRLIAKRAFFDLVTAETKAMMGAHHDDSA